MDNLHRIRLRRPWQFQATAGTARWTRRFNRPGRLGADERVWLVCEGFAGGPLGVALNGQPLGTLPGCGTAGRFEITGALAPRNELLLEGAEHAGSPALSGDQPPGEVCLEIGRLIQ
jgi:hypothetical protein